MKRTLIVVAVILFAAGLLLAFGRPESSAVKVCRADAQKFAEGMAILLRKARRLSIWSGFALCQAVRRLDPLVHYALRTSCSSR
jgi:hypothetical protein